jgi:hypothetical protein
MFICIPVSSKSTELRRNVEFFELMDPAIEVRAINEQRTQNILLTVYGQTRVAAAKRDGSLERRDGSLERCVTYDRDHFFRGFALRFH